jgi:hypothetical protein
MKRKYMSEFGLHSFSSHGTIFYPADLPILEFNEKYHIYMINLIPKLKFCSDSLIQNEGFISIKINVEYDGYYLNEIVTFTLGDFDHQQLIVSFDKPLKTINIMFDNDSGVGFRVLYLYNQYAKKPIDVEVIYVGQSYGESGSRQALDRLKSHSTLQKILADVSFNEEIREVAISLWEFTPRLLGSFDGISKNYLKNEIEDRAHFTTIVNSEHDYKQIINITEAALIHYFKPEYNEKFKNNFPLITHNGYKSYYDLDFNSLVVELDQHSILNGNLYSTFRNYEFHHNITYTLHPENIRRSMFDIFSEYN